MEDIYDNVTRLRTFFDYCDDDKDGYIDVEHFMSLAKDHFGGGELDIKVRRMLQHTVYLVFDQS